jgi:hypothetical protein
MAQFLTGLAAQGNEVGLNWLHEWDTHLLASARCWGKVTVEGVTAGKIRMLFHALDSDGSGTLTEDDFVTPGTW